MPADHTHIVDFDSVAIVVAPGEPDNPHMAKKFVLSWWEKNPPAALSWVARTPRGWCFFKRDLGIEGRNCCFRPANDPMVLMAMWGTQAEYSYIHEPGDAK